MFHVERNPFHVEPTRDRPSDQSVPRGTNCEFTLLPQAFHVEPFRFHVERDEGTPAQETRYSGVMGPPQDRNPHRNDVEFEAKFRRTAMSASANSLVISAAILFILTLSDPFIGSIVVAVRRAVSKPVVTETDAAAESLERDAA
jgi:hypothetical protein